MCRAVRQTINATHWQGGKHKQYHIMHATSIEVFPKANWITVRVQVQENAKFPLRNLHLQGPCSINDRDLAILTQFASMPS